MGANQEWLKLIKTNPKIRLLINQYQIDDITLVNNFSVLDKYIDNYIDCDASKPCLQKITGHMYGLTYENKLFRSFITGCVHSRKKTQNTNLQKSYLFYDFGDNNLVIDIRKDWNHSHDLSRKQLTIKIVEFQKKFLHQVNNAELVKGLYIYGEPGVGKTYICIALANYLASKKVSVSFVNVISLTAKLKENFEGNNNYNSVYNRLMQSDVLFLDDIGGEMVSRWFRDEVLFNLLNYRLNLNKPTFFTSNFTLKQLFGMYSKIPGEDQQIAQIKAKRVMERIRALSEPQKLEGDSLRR